MARDGAERSGTALHSSLIRLGPSFMFPINRGELIAIDFGHAFGSATSLLGVPELIPFRLSRQMVEVMAPYRAGGLYQHTMTRVLTRTLLAAH